MIDYFAFITSLLSLPPPFFSLNKSKKNLDPQQTRLQNMLMERRKLSATLYVKTDLCFRRCLYVQTITSSKQSIFFFFFFKNYYLLDEIFLFLLSFI